MILPPSALGTLRKPRHRADIEFRPKGLPVIAPNVATRKPRLARPTSPSAADRPARVQLASQAPSAVNADGAPRLASFQCYRTNGVCGPLAPRNSGGECETEQACGGLDGETTFCRSARFQPSIVELSNRFEAGTFSVRKPLDLCNPADENGDGIENAVTHLRGYDILESPDSHHRSGHTRQSGLRIENEFHPSFGELVVDTVKSEALLVPSAKSHGAPVSPLDPASHGVDHFQCYKVVHSPKSPHFVKKMVVAVDDQFRQPKIMRLVAPSRLCVPVDVDGRGVKDDATNLMCYRIEPEGAVCSADSPANAWGTCKNEKDCGGTQGKTSFCPEQTPHIRVSGLRTANEIAPDERFDTIREEELCVPSRVVGQDDADGDGFTTAEGDCDDTNPSIYPGALEVCGNGIDDDCDGEVDDPAECSPTCTAGDPCSTGLPGPCSSGHTTCPNGPSGESVCEADNGPTTEVCNGLDDDCDGATDEDLGQTTCGLGACSHTVANCAGGMPQTCNPLQGAGAEICDGVDNDCDGAIDENLGQTTCGLGACSHTVENCAGGIPQSCDRLQGASPEICDGIDNNCDGAIDEGLGQTTCGRGLCQHTVEGCAGAPQTCDPFQGASPEICDGLDNDCDGTIDEGLGQTTCGFGVCRHTVDNCAGGVPHTCDPLQGAGPEICDGLDNDCDGPIDEDLGQTTCGLGRCRHTADNCAGGVPQTCDPLQGASPEMCDGVDNDCDGIIDEGLGQTMCGVSACRHTVENCVGGLPQSCDPLQGASPEVCDGLDNDCDGAIDEGLGQTTCGLGACSHTVLNCAGGMPQTCDPLQGASAESCDGVDNDCDGSVDEGLGQTTCGIGPCERTMDNCANGTAQTCTPGLPASEDCDNDVDDDCDGVVNQEAACPNRPPLAQDDAYEVRIGETLNVPASGVLANDGDPDRDALSSMLLTSPANGTLAFNADGSFSYTPNVPSPTAGTFNPVVKFHALDGTAVISTPLVANLTDDNGDGMIDNNDVPDIIINTADRVIKAFSGDDGHELFTTTGSANLVAQFTNIALGDIDGDGLVEIVACHNDGSHLIAFEHTGAFKWLSDAHTLPGRGDTRAAISIANLDGSGLPEIVAGAAVYSADGKFLGDGQTLGGTPGINAGRAAVSVVADIDLDGIPEIIAGPTVYRFVNGALTVVWHRTDLTDGLVGVGNFDDDPYAEIVLVSEGRVQMLNHDGTNAEVWNPPSHGPVTLAGGGGGGAPTIADVDADGLPEIGIAGLGLYTVYERDGKLRWSSPTQDFSAVTSATVFDFEGDGSAEVVYRDEMFLRVYRGTTGKILFQMRMTSNTVNEQPIVADVDNDGHAEIVVSSDRNINVGPPLTSGLFVIEDANDTWMRTRRIWNQHTYHITNISEDGTIPLVEQNNWLVPGLNNFRLNSFEPGDAAQADRFTYKANDGSADSSAATVLVTLLPKNSAPEITSAPVTRATAHLAYAYAVAATDPDPGDILTFSLPAAPAGMTIVAGTGLIRWTPTDAQVGSHQVTVKVSDRQNFFALQGYMVEVETPTTVPDVGGLPQAEAESRIVDADLTAGTVTQAHSTTVPAGSVIGQNPPGGAEAVRGSAVDLVVSIGPAPEDIDEDGDGFTENQGDCNDADPAIRPGAMETCDGLDNDCDGATDEGLGQTTCGVGRCQHTVQNCAGGTTQTCDPLQGASVEVCDGVDNDCDGTTDEGFGQTTCGVGVCRHTVDNCAGGTTQKCNPLQGASAEVCDGLDNDCDGATDDGLGQTTCGVGACRRTVANCVGGVPQSCTPGVPVPEVCGNSVDDDCDGEVDDPVVCDAANVDDDHDGFTENQGDCNDGDPGVHPGATDVPGNGVDENCNGADAVAGDNTPPTARLDLPADDAEILTPADLIGTADDQNLLRYTLELARVNETTFSRFASGSARVVNGVLGQFDPTVLENGMYRIRLTAEDANGLTASAEKVYRVTGQAKAGVLALSWVDLSVPVSGIPITLIRSYDSRVKGKRDFGVGWTLDVRRGSYENNRKPGDGWQVVKGPGLFGLPCEVVNETRTHITEVRLSDRDVYRFKLAIFNFAPFAGGCQGEARFDFVSGPPGAELAIFGSTTVLFRDGSNEVIDADTFATYNPSEVRLTLEDGRKIDLDRNARGITRIEDTNGNSLDISAAGIVHSSGKSIAFARDLAGRITRITDPMGRTLQYAYDSAGDLVAFIDQLGNRTQFTYDGQHNLLDIEDPLGRRPIRSEYDARGRLVAITDARGNRITLTHNLGTRQEVLTDRLGNITVLTYDERGNVLQRTDALGNTTSLTYDSRDNPLSETDQLGHTTTSTYDAQGNVLSWTDPLGSTARYTYNARTMPLTVTDALGRQASFVYDSRSNLLTETDRLGNVVTHLYNNEGNPLLTTDALGNQTSFAYDTSGNQIRVTDPLGVITNRTYDANNNVLTESTTRLVGGVPQAVVQRFAYDALNRLIETTDPEGGVTRIAYTATGKEASRTDRRNKSTTYEYDEGDRLVRTVFPDGLDETIAYDAEGHQIATTDRAGRTTTYAYDRAGRLVQTTFPDGAITRVGYDAAGRITSETDENNHTTSFTYDAAGRTTAVRDPLGNTTTFAHDAANKLVSLTDRNGRTTTFTYDEAGRRVRTTFPDGTFTTTAYDANGRIVARTDEAGNTTRFAHDAHDNLIAVIDALGQSTRFAYDEVGNRISQTDALGDVIRFTYDRLGRRVGKTLPLGQTEVRSYDATGNLLSLQDFNGAITTYAYDAFGRLSRRTLPSAVTLDHTYTATGQRATLTDDRGVTTFTYDQRDRPVQVQYADGRELHYTYDARGNRTSVNTPGGTTTFEYDANDRLVAVTDPQGRRTDYGYDAEGNRTGASYPNGITTAYGYDALNRAKDITHRRGATILSSYAYTLGPAGNRTGVVEHGGRTVDYTYDPLLQLIGETITTPASGTTAISYTYDAAGNRSSRTDASGTIAYTHDANSRLTSAGAASYSYDANGNMLSRTDAGGTTTYQYDPLRRLVQVAAPDGVVIGYTYDGLDNRVQAVDPASTTNYLVDPFDPSGFAQVLRETDGAGTAMADYVYGLDLISMQKGGAVSFFPHDGQLSTRLLADAAGAVKDAYDFDAFGNLLTRTGTTANNYLYNGQQLDPRLGFYYLRARYYDPGVGRFLTNDPLEGSIFDPRSLHPYAYAQNDPVNRSDPSGEGTATTIEELEVVQAAEAEGAGVSFSFGVKAGASAIATALAAVCITDVIDSLLEEAAEEATGVLRSRKKGPCDFDFNKMELLWSDLFLPVPQGHHTITGLPRVGVTHAEVRRVLSLELLTERLDEGAFEALNHMLSLRIGGVEAVPPDPRAIVAEATTFINVGEPVASRFVRLQPRQQQRVRLVNLRGYNLWQ